MADDEAFMELYLEQDLARATPHTITDPQEIRDLARLVRDQGYAVNHSWWREGVFAVSSVVHDATGKAIAALGLMMPEVRHELNDDQLGELMCDVAGRASARFGYRGVQPVAGVTGLPPLPTMRDRSEA